MRRQRRILGDNHSAQFSQLSFAISPLAFGHSSGVYLLSTGLYSRFGTLLRSGAVARLSIGDNVMPHRLRRNRRTYALMLPPRYVYQNHSPRLCCAAYEGRSKRAIKPSDCARRRTPPLARGCLLTALLAANTIRRLKGRDVYRTPLISASSPYQLLANSDISCSCSPVAVSAKRLDVNTQRQVDATLAICLAGSVAGLTASTVSCGDKLLNIPGRTRGDRRLNGQALTTHRLAKRVSSTPAKHCFMLVVVCIASLARSYV